jgi:hypothetical protein
MKLRTEFKRVEIQFDAPVSSSDGGVLALERVDKKLSLTARMGCCLTDWRKGDSAHSLTKMLAQRVYGIGLGWEDCNDFDKLKCDPLYSLTLGEAPASQPTLSRFENSVGAKDLYRLSLELVHVFVDAHKASPPKQIVIDMDATDDPAHGQQELEFYHGYYGKHCFLPLLVFCSADGQDEELVAAILRPGNIHAGRRSAAILKRLALLLKEAFPNAHILFRGDAGFAMPEMYETCEELGISYLISLARNSRLQEIAEPLMMQSRLQRDNTLSGARVFGETSYAAQTWTRERRVLIKAETMEKGDNPRFVVTNLEGDPEELYRIYCKRGDCENRIKELKLDLSSGRTSCHSFKANCFRLILHAIAFVLLSALRQMLAGTSLARATMGQIRLKLLKVAAILQRSTRRILVRLPRDHPHADILERLLC